MAYTMCTQPDDCYCTTRTCFVVSSELTASVYGQISEHQRKKKRTETLVDATGAARNSIN